MKKLYSAVISAFLMSALFIGTSASAEAGSEICAINDTDQTMYFSIRNWSAKVERELAPRRKICLIGETTGWVNISRDEYDLDTCESIIHPNNPISLIEYRGFEDCIWTDTGAPKVTS